MCIRDSLLSVPNLEAIIREKDDFEFCKDEFVCTYDNHALGGITEQCTGMTIAGEETTQVGFAAKPTDLMPPSYLMPVSYTHLHHIVGVCQEIIRW